MATTQEKIDKLRLEIEQIEQDMMGEKSVSVDGKITVSKRSSAELQSILARKEQQLADLLGETSPYGNATMGIRGGFGI